MNFIKKNILISGNMISGGLTKSIVNNFKNNNWEVSEFDDQSLINTLLLSKNKYTFRILWKYLSYKIQYKFWNLIKETKPENILIFKGFYFSSLFISKIKLTFPKIYIIHFNPDNNFNNWHFGNSNHWIVNSIKFYDLNLTWGKFLIPQLYSYNAKHVEYFPFGCDTDLHYPVKMTLDEFQYFKSDISFVGSWDKEREKILFNLLDYNLKIWGNGWEKSSQNVKKKWMKQEVVGENFSKVCSASKININLIRKQNLPGHNMRTFEIPACKGFSLNTRTSEQVELFKQDEEQICFSNTSELRSKIDNLLVNDNIRNKITKKSYEKVTQIHTYNCRVKKIINIIANREIK